GRTRLEDLGVGVERIAVEDRGAKAELVERHLGERVLGRVLGREADHDRARDQTEDQAAAERGPLHAVLVEVRVRGVHHELREELVLAIAAWTSTRCPRSAASAAA